MSETVRIFEDETYEHDEYGEVEVLDVYQEAVGVEVQLDEDGERVGTNTHLEWHVAYEYDNGIRRGEDPLNTFYDHIEG